MAMDSMMLSPMPRKAPQSVCSAPTSPYPESNIDLNELQSARPIWYDIRDEATQDLQEVFSCEKALRLPGWINAFESRSGSAASTSATATPNHWYFSQASSPEHELASPSHLVGDAFESFESTTDAFESSEALTDGHESPVPRMRGPPAEDAAGSSRAAVPGTPLTPTQRLTRPFCPEGAAAEMAKAAPADVLEILESSPSTQQPPCPPGALDKTSWLQARKVFVGGIPQSMDQNGLYQKFSKLGKVKKAWLQLKHGDQDGNKDSPAKQHRGFGFVIFYEKQVIDALLGDHEARFVRIDEDLQVEVKRAFGKTGNEASPNTKAKKQPTKAPVVSSASQSSHHAPLGISSPAVAPATSQTSLSSAIAAATCLTPAPQSGVPMAWASPVVVFTFPCVPAFPFPAPSPPAPVPQFPIAGAGVVQAAGSFPSTLIDRPRNESHQPPCHFVQKPTANQALVQALLQAMPDHYED